jgi:hypothetical protein
MTNPFVIAVAGALVLLPTSAFAQSSAPEQGRGLPACAAEIASLCQSAEPGGGRKLSCLVENKSKLGSECAAAVDIRVAERSARESRMAACRTDLASLCQDAERGSGRRMACLRDNQAKLSPDCASALGTIK